MPILSSKHVVDVWHLRRTHKYWLPNASTRQPVSPVDTRIMFRKAVRVPLLQTDDEEVIEDAAKHYIASNALLSKKSLKEFIQHVLRNLPAN